MLHEILLSLSGHPSPLLRTPASSEADAAAGITPPERQLLASAGHISDLHTKLIAFTSEVSASHPSTVCRAVASAITSVHIAAFQKKVLDVEAGILSNDPALVGAYDIVPLTAVMGEFQQWTRRLEWLWDTVRFVMAKDEQGHSCRGAALIDRLRDELQSGYQDVADTAARLVAVAETAWLKQVSAWVLYGRLPSFGGDDFFVQEMDGVAEDFVCEPSLLPSFVSSATATSMVFIGRSLNHVRAMDQTDSMGASQLAHVPAKLQELASLTFPLEGSDFARAIRAIRVSLARNTLQKMLPLAKVVEMLEMLRDFFLLGKGEFAMALTHEADEKLRSRWRRAGQVAHDKDAGLKNVTVKDGEVAAVLNRTWAVLVSLQGQQADEDDQLELARGLIQLHLLRTKPPAPLVTGRGLDVPSAELLASSPFRNLLFSVPAMLSVELPSPLDMVISASDLQLYSCINAYLLSLRRAHIRLTDLWKITSLRRHYPAPLGAGDDAVTLRERWTDRAWLLRNSWTTASAAIFFLAETEAYFQTEIVEGLWDGFSNWLVPGRRQDGGLFTRPASRTQHRTFKTEDEDMPEADAMAADDTPAHDPQALSTALTLFLRTLSHRLLLTQSSFTEPLYALLTQVDHLVSHMQRLHSIFTAMDLETDAGVVDTAVDFAQEEGQVLASLRQVEARVQQGIRAVVAALRALEADSDFLAEWDGQGLVDEEVGLMEETPYEPSRVGGVERLLIKLEFGSWL